MLSVTISICSPNSRPEHLKYTLFGRKRQTFSDNHILPHINAFAVAYKAITIASILIKRTDQDRQRFRTNFFAGILINTANIFFAKPRFSGEDNIIFCQDEDGA